MIDNILAAPPGSDPQPIGDFCPALGAVAVLATSRQDTREAHVRTIQMDILERDPAILLLTDNVPGAATLPWTDWGRIAEWVGDLPIALDLLNRSLALGSITPIALLQRVGQVSRPVRELDRLREALRGQVPKDAVCGVTEAFSISFERLDDTARAAALLLAQLAPSHIPEEFMEALPDEWKSPAVRAALRSRHFLTGASELSFGVMHRLIADFLRSLAEGSAPELVGQACTALRQVMTPDRCRNPRDWPVMQLCRPHAEALFARGSAVDVASAASNEMGLAAAFLASAQGDYAGARRIEERVVEVTSRILGKEHPQTLISMDNLAETLRMQGDYAGARHLQEQVLEVITRVLGEEHPNSLTAMNNLAETFRTQGDYAGARRLQEQVLEARTRLLGGEHPDTLTAMNNLAATLGAQGDHAAARWFRERVLEAMMRTLGEEHPRTLASMNNLAETLGAQGDHAAARRLQERVFDAMTRVLGEEHPDTLRSMYNLAPTLRAQGDLAGARQLQERVLEAMTRVLGEEHSDTLLSMGNLAFTLAAQGDREGALRLLRTCLSGQRKVLGADHPTTVTTAKALSRLEAQPPTIPPSS